LGNITYRILVVDDEKNVQDLFEPFKDILLDDDELSVHFEYMDNITNFKINEPYDIVVFDSKFLNTKHDFSHTQKQKTIGFNLIKNFRQNNRRTKIIFCSSHFDLSEPDQIPYGPKDFFTIINELNIFRIVNKNRTIDIYNAIKDAIEDLDIIMVMLEKMSRDYDGLDIE
jgi:CheY-like chemotaxis protein